MDTRNDLLPYRPLDQITRPLARFLHLQAAGGVVLLVVTAIALAAANSPLAADYHAFWETMLAFRIGEFELNYPLWYWVNDALMVIFFFVIGLEIKRELVAGELRERRKVVLPAVAAVGGATVPVIVFLAVLGNAEGREGWAIPMATDIAFVVGCLALLGQRIPPGLKIFMLSLAIIDDILAVAVIALFFSESISLIWLAGALIGFVVTVGLNKAGVRQVSAYVVVGAAIWLCTLKSGVHPTVAGAALGLLTPANAWIGETALFEVVDRAMRRIRGGSGASEASRRGAAEDLVFAATESIAPLERLERALHPWVGFVIMPVFALANAGVHVSLGGVKDPVALAVALGLLVGKPVGIVGASWLVVKLGWGQLPDRTSWRALTGGACLGGIGFTMALFVASLSLKGEHLDAAKTGVLAASALSIVLGLALLATTFPTNGPKGPAPGNQQK